MSDSLGGERGGGSKRRRDILCEVKRTVDIGLLDWVQVVYPTVQNGTGKWLCLNSILTPVSIEHTGGQVPSS